MTGQGARSWGWHQLHATWAERFVADAQVRQGELVLDIGAGAGALTAPLVERGVYVVAVELHPGRARALRERFAGDPVRVVQADAASLRLPRRPFRVVANPPFGITTPLLRRLLAPGSRLVAADLILQRHATARWVLGRAPGAGRWMQTYDVQAGRRIPASAFSPRAPVDCVTLRVRRY